MGRGSKGWNERLGMRPERSRGQTCHQAYKCRVRASAPTLGETGAHQGVRRGLV